MSAEFVSTRQFWTGCLYAGVGGAALYLAQDYRLGTLERMGPGYFPTALAVLLVLIGLACIARSVYQGGKAVSRIAWRPLLFITVAIAGFAYLLPLLGLPLAIIFMIGIGSLASRTVSFDPRFLIAMTGFVLGCIGLFIYGLGVSMPLLGNLF